MTGLGRVVRAGVGRRRVQTVVIGLATMMAVTTSVLGGSLLVASDAPFDQAFAAQRGAHLTAQFDAGRVDGTQLAATAHTASVTAAAGPFRTVQLTPVGGSDTGDSAGAALSPMTVVGRAAPSGGVDQVKLSSGRWATGPGEIVLSAQDAGPDTRPGTRLRLPDLSGSPTLTVVGIADSVSATADAWVAPSEAAALTAAGATGGYQMLYRFASADSSAQITADRAAVAAAVPAGALTGVQSWLNVKQGTDRNTALFIPFLIAFGLLGVAMSVLMVGTVVAGSVGAGTRRIGILKSIGFTPAQVVRSYTAQALIPAAVGAVLGVVLGDLLTVPVLSSTDQVYGTSDSGVSPWVDAVVVLGALSLAGGTALAAALRAGRLRTVVALAVGRTPRPGRGQWATRLGGRLPLPRSLSLGLAQPFARPARTLAMVLAIVFGATAVTFALGIGDTLAQVQAAKDHDTADVKVRPPRETPGAGSEPASATMAPGPRNVADPAAVEAAIKAQPGTASYFGTADTEASVAGVTGSTSVYSFSGDASHSGFAMVSGTWFHGAGQVVVPTTFLTATGTRVGDSVTLEYHGRAVPVRIVGEVLDPHTQTMEVLTDSATLGLRPMGYSIVLKPGTDKAGYVAALNSALGPQSGVVADGSKDSHAGGAALALQALTVALTTLLAATAALGVFNSVVLDTRERVHDLGVHKALGMTPRQTVGMVLASVTVVGLIGGAIGVPLGVALHALTVPAMGHSAGITMPASVVDVFQPSELALLLLGGLVMAVLGALVPAGWAARARTATALRTE